MISIFLEYISNFVQLDPQETQAISSLIQIKKFKKGEILLKEGMISRTSYFNLKGCVRMYYNLKEGEKTTFFYTENQFILSMSSFTHGTPSNHFLECTEESQLAIIPYDIEMELLKRFPKIQTFTKAVLEKELGNYQEMLSAYIISSPEQRYLNLLKNNPTLLQRVPLFQLATFIGVQPESLSRLRNRLAKRIS